ncbi:PREDICTED: ras GTPase-activating protein-binding protein 1 [Camelina sativa]|uniref:Ras GTPase-activating protein-binding protein 1 n=1 Tax=Camelina sativa TaxID=90675 RepID=A0ABM0SSM4_CAMSA|nr:PREDICTED: ras GTPase-activating protein-binding protein 1 [Camelina sativa]
MATEEGVHSAQKVSASFVEQYFSFLKSHTQEACRFYVDASVVTRPKPDGTMMSFTSVEAIKEQILSSDYENTTFEIKSVDSQTSFEDGIFIMVVGFLTGKDNLRRKFSQMFYLAHRNQENPTYDVLNDIFRYVDDDDSTPKSLPATEKVKPAEEVKKTEKSVTAAVTKNAVAIAAAPLDNGKVKRSEEKAVAAQKPTEPVAETVAPQPKGAKKSFAAIVQSAAHNVAPFQVKAVKAPVQKPKVVEKPRAAGAPQKPASVSNSVKKSSQRIIDEPGTAIFVANLPMNAMPPQLHELFKDFGPIKENGIQVRSSRGQTNAVCFGFISFESASSVQSVLQAAKNTPFMLADRKLRVKEKEVDYDGSKQPSGKTRGGNSVSKPQPQAQAPTQAQAENGSAAPADEGDEFTLVISRRNRRGGSGGSSESKTQNGSADGEDEFKPVRSRRNGGRNERRGGARTGNGDINQKHSEGRRAP